MPSADQIEQELAQLVCGLTTAALVSQGVDPTVAAVIGEKACVPAAKKGFTTARKKTVKAAKKGVKDIRKSKAMKKAQAKARLKSGKFRKGWGKSKLMKEYHRILKRLK